jgi:hypothetical protein
MRMVSVLRRVGIREGVRLARRHHDGLALPEEPLLALNHRQHPAPGDLEGLGLERVDVRIWPRSARSHRALEVDRWRGRIRLGEEREGLALLLQMESDHLDSSGKR